MKMLSSLPLVVGVYKGVMETNLDRATSEWQYGMKERRRNKNALVMNRAQEIKTWSELELRGARLDDGADNRDVYILGTNIVGRGYHRDVDICVCSVTFWCT